MRKLVLMFVLSLCAGAFALAQVEGSDAQSNIGDLGSGSSMFRSFDNRFKGVVGSPTFLEMYKPGLIQTVSGKWFQNDSANYDAFNDDLLVKRLGTEAIVSKGLVSQFVLLDRDSVRFVKKELPGGNTAFLRVIVNGNDDVKLYAKETKAISEPTNTGAYSSGKSYREFELKTTYVIESAAGMTEVKSKKDVGGILPARQAEIETFMKRERTNIKKEKDLRNLVLYLNKIS